MVSVAAVVVEFVVEAEASAQELEET